MIDDPKTGSLVAHRYRLDRMLGQGGYGAVYRALDMVRGGDVALKLMHAHLTTHASGRQRFEREADVVQQLSHENIVGLLDYGVDDSQIPYIAFELLEGRSLHEELKRCGALPLERVVDIARQVLNALQTAHDHGIIHRDIKPANIFLCGESGAKDVVKVLDFGIAKAPASENKDALTATGQLLGTAQYMAPEQVKGEAIDATVDLYALGATMAEMLAGEKLVKGGSAMEVFILQIEDVPLAMPESIRGMSVVPVIQRAVAKTRALRFNSAAQMLQQLELCASGRVSGSLEPPPPAGGTVPLPSMEEVAAYGKKPTAPIATVPPPRPALRTEHQYPSLPRPTTGGYGPAQTPLSHTPPPLSHTPPPLSHTPPPPHQRPFPRSSHGGAPFAGQHAPSVSRGNNRLWVVALLVCGVVIAGLVATLVFQNLGDSDDDDGDATGNAQRPRDNEDDLEDDVSDEDLGPPVQRVTRGSLDHVDASLLRRRLRKAGATVKDIESPTTSPLMEFAGFTLSGKITGAVQFARYKDSTLADAHFKGIEGSQFVAARTDGNTVVMVVASFGNANALMHKLVRRQ